jgi:ABC-type nitrate/sulfonate/bicarbonate transport system permease component
VTTSNRRSPDDTGVTRPEGGPSELSVSPMHDVDSAEEANAAAPPGPAGAPGPRSSRWLQPLIGVVGAFVLFELIPRIGLIDEQFFPPASAMVAALFELIADGALWEPLGQTLQGWALGLGTALLISLPLGIIIGSVYLLFMASRSIVEFLRPVPSVALIPLAVLVFGAGLESKWFLAAFAATWPILLQTLYGVRDVDPTALETAKSFGIPRLERLRRVVLPSALPYIATGVRISSSVALILAVTAELVLGIPGLGQVINVARQSGAVENMYGLIIATGLLGWGLNGLMTLLERRLLRWHPSVRGTTR